jgi:hypothetical protein
MTSLFDKFNEAKKTSNDEHYTTISVRTPTEVASMVETVSIVTQEAVMNMFTSGLSSYLADYLREDSRNMELIEQVLQEEFNKYGSELSSMVSGSCIGVLKDRKIIDIKGYIRLGGLA